VNVDKEGKEEKPLAKDVKEECVPAAPSAKTTETAAAPRKFVSINSGKQREPRERPHGKKAGFDMKTLESSLVPGEEEEAVVLLPNIRRHLAPEIEPSPVLLPVSVGLKSCGNIKFGQSAAASTQLLFGEQPGKPSVGAGSEENVSSAASQPSYTTTSIDALPSPIGSPTFAAQEQPQQQQEPSPFASSPPGLSANAGAASNAMGGYYQHPRFPGQQSHQQHRSAAPLGFDQMESPRAPYQHYAQHHRQAYDPYGQQQLGSHQSRYEVPFNSRYAVPYGGAVQPSLEDAFVGSSNYYGGGVGGRGQGSNSYYPASSSSYAQQQMMYGGGSESYAVGSATANFTPASARYQPSPNTNPNSSYGSAQPHHHHHHHHQQQQQHQQQHYSYSASSSAQQASATAAFPGNPANRSPSRMF
jgi:hypothetical protein